jgi:drug/metabolite transporter (DMT)-like permease
MFTRQVEPVTIKQASAATDAREIRPLRGIVLTIVGIACITCNDALMKLAVGDYSISQAIGIRGLFALVPIALLVHRAGGLTKLRVHRLSTHCWCALLLASPIFLYIFSLRHLPLSTATIMFFTNPLFVTLLAPWMLHERIPASRIVAVLVGFSGAAMVVNPTQANFTWIILLPLLVALLTGLREIVVRAALAREHSVALLFYSTSFVTLLALATAPFGWRTMALADLATLAMSGVLFALGVYLMTEGLRFADASLLALFKYSAIVWALLLGFFLWQEIPTMMTWLGAALIVASGWYTVSRAHSSR